MMRGMITRLTLLLCMLLCAPLLAQTPPPAPAIDPKADEILKQMGKALADAKSYSVEVHNTADEVLPSGQVVQFARNQKIHLRRPDRVAATVVGDREEMQFAYDGKQVVIYNVNGKAWSSVKAPATIDQTMDMLANQYGMALPLVDLLVADPYKDLIARVKNGQYIGTGYVLDTKCHHLAFRQDAIDWQIWIEDGATALPRKIVITQKESPIRSQYVAIMSNWKLNDEHADDAFTLQLPADAKKVEFAVPAPTPPSEPQPKPGR
jgi:hypothetical protein